MVQVHALTMATSVGDVALNPGSGPFTSQDSLPVPIADGIAVMARTEESLP